MHSYQAYVVRADDARYHGGTRSPADVDAVVWHCTAGDTIASATSWLNRKLGVSEHPGSYHYLIAKEPGPGAIRRMTDPLVIAWHAGKSAPPGSAVRPWSSVNHRAIGVAFANDNGTDGDLRDDPLTEFQLNAGLWLGVTLMRNFPRIVPDRNWGHIEVAPGRKFDPLPRILDMNNWRKRLGEALNG